MPTAKKVAAPRLKAPWSGWVKTVAVPVPRDLDWCLSVQCGAPETPPDWPVYDAKPLYESPQIRHGIKSVRVHFVWFGEWTHLDVIEAVYRMKRCNPTMYAANPYLLWWAGFHVRKIVAHYEKKKGDQTDGLGFVATEAARSTGEVCCMWFSKTRSSVRAHLYSKENEWQDQTVFAFTDDNE